MTPNPIKILIVNPNTNQSMTDALHAPLESLNYNNTAYTYITSPPGGIPSINSPSDGLASTQHTLPTLLPHLPTHHAILIACYSPHPLTSTLSTHPLLPPSTPVLGIFEASIHTALQLLRPGETFGIVTTGTVWRDAIEEAVKGMVGNDGQWERRFGGVECVGVGAGELHGEGDVEGRVRGATKRLVGGDGAGGEEGGKVESKGEGRIGVVILGCAGMVGMEEWVRGEAGEGVRVVDGVRAGVGVLQGLVRGGF